MTTSEQEYLRQIYLYTQGGPDMIHTKQLAIQVKARSASVTDMVKRLADKELLVYSPYRGCYLSDKGKGAALQVIRRHRLWELFLAEKLGIDWKEVHAIATRLQSIQSPALIEGLSEFLGHPTYDPHGEAIPDEHGNLPETAWSEIYDLKIGQEAVVFGYRDTGKAFLQYVEKLHLLIGTSVKVLSIIDYNFSIELLAGGTDQHIISKETAQKIYVKVIE
jgi:DtxR family Mn-dependent transcriptional regulator